MNKTFQLSKIATRMSVLFGSSLLMPFAAQANSCTAYSAAGVCGLEEYEMTSPLDPKPVAWYFTAPSQDAAINSTAKAQNIYLASGTSSRKDKDIQRLLVDGADLSGYYINASKNGSAEISLVNNATVDWIEAGGANTLTHTRILVEGSTLNGANAEVDYDKRGVTPVSKAYASGWALFLTPNDSIDVTIANDSKVNGGILASGTGAHRITLQDSSLTGALYAASPEAITAVIDNSHVTGDITANGAAKIAMDITRSVLTGSVDAHTGSGTVDVKITDSTLSGDINLAGKSIQRADVWLTSAKVGGNLYGSGENSTLHLAGNTSLDGKQFSHFSQLTFTDSASFTGGFSNENVGTALTVTGGSITAPVQLSSGKLTFSGTKIIADTLSLSSGASLAMTNGSQLQTRSDRLFNASTAAALPGGFNATGKNLSLTDSTLILTDSTYRLDYVTAVNALIGAAVGNSLVMLGKIENPGSTGGTASVADASTSQATLATTQVTSSKNRLVIGAGNAQTESSIAVANGFGASQLRFEGSGTPKIEIEGDQSLTLTGAAGGALIEVAGQPNAAVDIAVNQGTLNLGSTVAGSESNHLNGRLTLSSDGSLNILAGDHTIASGSAQAGVVSSGKIAIAQHAALHADVDLKDSAQLAVNGALMAERLNASKDAQIAVGSADSAGTLIAQALNLQGARMFIDPAWSESGTLASASTVVVGSSDVNGRLTVGQNSLLVLGDTSTAAAEAEFADSGLRWGQDAITAALAIQAPQTLNAAQGGLKVDGSLTGSASNRDAAFNTAEFADRSLLMVDGAALTAGRAALNAENGTLKVASGAALYVADAKANQTYSVAKGFSDINIASGGWQNDNLRLNRLLSATTTARNGEVTVSTKARDAQDVLPGIATPNALNTLIASGENDRTANAAGQRFLSIAVDTPDVTNQQIVRTVNSAAQMAIAGGAQSNTWAAGMAAIDALLDRTSLANAPLQNDLPDASVWVHALYGNARSSDLSAGSLRYGQDSNFYGLMLGADKAYGTDFGEMRSGAAFHAGNGDSDSRGDFSATHNDFSFWGVSLYQSWTQRQLSVTGDVSLTQSSNDINQKQPGWLGMGSRFDANVDAQMLSAGLRGEYRIETGVVDVIPYAGARYSQLKTDAFDTKSGSGEKVFHTDKGSQDIWQFPVGVKVNKTFALDSGWNLSAQADAGVVAVTGDRDIDSRLHAVGIRGSDAISAETLDDTAFTGQAGVKFQKGNMTFGVGYSVNASDHETRQGVTATYRLAF